jgi:hypothetical protein
MLREEHRLRMFENRVLRRIFGPKRDEVTGEWRKLHNEELHNFYSSPDISKNSKAVPLRAMEALGGERRYSSYSFTTSALDGGEWSASRPGRALPLGKGCPLPIVQETGWAPELVWIQRLGGKNPLPLPGIEPRSPGRPVRSQALYCLS